MKRLRRPSGELIAYIVLVLVALGLRLYQLGDRPFHHDESQDAYFSWILWTKGDYKYQPILHGPLRFYLTASMYSLFGDSDFTARLAPALMGTSMVAMPYFLRRQLGHVAAFTAAVLLAIGPSYLYFSRFAREDIYFAAVSFALLVVVFRFLDRPRVWHPALIGALIALGFAIKETMYITGFVAFTFFVLLFWREGRGGETWATIKSVGWEAWVWALAAFAGVFTLMFTVFLTNPSGCGTASTRASPTGSASTTSAAAARSPTSTSSSCSRTSGRCCCSGCSARCFAFRQPNGAARVPRVGVRAVAGHLLVGGREVLLARAAPAAAADPAGRRRGAVAVGQPRDEARPRRASRSPR